MEDNISKIKDRVDIVDLVGNYVKLSKAGVNFKARCPFHNEKSGSFFVSPERQIWHCFGCGLGGDIFGFIKQIEGVEFPEALRILATRAGVELHAYAPEERDTKSRLYEINALSAKFFEKQLRESKTGKEALTYLKDRGLTDKTIEEFHLGFAPDSWDGLHVFLERSYEPRDIVNAGLSIKKENGPGCFDRFRSRIMFPISDVNGQIVGFTGRVFGELAKNKDAGKYVNTPQTPIYDKSRVLYGLDKAKLEIRRSDKCLIVEGNMDVIASHQAGVKNVIASSGTALTDGHLKLIKRYTDTLDICFDADEAGDAAARRGIGLALARGFNVGVLEVSGDGIKDPADYVNKYGDQWAEYVKKSRPFMDVYFSKALNQYDITTAGGKKKFSSAVLPMVASLSNKVEAAHWVGEISLTLKVSEGAVRSELAITRPLTSVVSTVSDHSEPDRNPSQIDEIKSLDSPDMFEETLLGMIIKWPSLINELPLDRDEVLSQHSLDLCNVIDAIARSDAKVAEDSNLLMRKLVGTGDNARDMKLEFAYLKSQALWDGFEEAQAGKEFQKLLNYMKRRKILFQLESLEYDIKSAERARDNEKLNVLLAKFSALSESISK